MFQVPIMYIMSSSRLDGLPSESHLLTQRPERVRDRETLEPATAETAAICERLLELGVVMQPTSDRLCVLKVKPPLGLTAADAGFFADALDHVLTEGW
jgi:4-aminobutyrate aminotransferase-like enzyme